MINILTLSINFKCYFNVKILLNLINDNKNNVLSNIKITFYEIVKYLFYKTVVIS